MIYKDGTVTVVSGTSIVKGTGTKWNSNNPLVSPGMLMLIKNGDINYPYMILSVNSDTELNLADKPTFSATDTTYTINLTEPENSSDAARSLAASNTYIIYFLQNMNTWMTENGVVDITLPSGKTIKLESIKALQELVEGKADVTKVEEISKAVADKFDKNGVLQEIGTATDKVMSQKANTDAFAKKSSTETLKIGRLNVESATGDTIFNLGGTNGSAGSEIAYVRNSKRTQIHDVDSKTTILFPKNSGTLALTNNPTGITAPTLQVKSLTTHGYLELIAANGNTWRIGSNNNDQRSYFEKVGKFSIYLPEKGGALALTSDIPKMMADSNGFLKRASPIVKIHPDGSFETNDESEGVNVLELVNILFLA
ncbi:hypothetical protein [Arsenophonus nasoniae]|uniref:phage tail fiber protein n=1 Tax=Arsenophonus nasoniae TaxID=638 RepID=UPI003879413C